MYNLNHVFGFKLYKLLFPIMLLVLEEREMTKVLKKFGERSFCQFDYYSCITNQCNAYPT